MMSDKAQILVGLGLVVLGVVLYIIKIAIGYSKDRGHHFGPVSDLCLNPGCDEEGGTWKYCKCLNCGHTIHKDACELCRCGLTNRFGKESFANFLRRRLEHKEIGWREIGEEFTRYQLLKTRWFNVYLHRLWAPNWHPECHDHPWGFVAVLLWRGYLERVARGGRATDHRRWPGMVLFRPATFTHNVITPYGVSWSLIITTPKSRDWGFKPCDHQVGHPTTLYNDYVQRVKEGRK